MGLKAGRKLLLTSGCSMLIGSEPLLPQVQNEEISFITQHISMDEVANSFWRAMQPETMDRLTAADLNGINAIISLALPDELDQSLAGVTLPSSLQTLTFGRNFDQSFGRCDVAKQPADFDLWTAFQSEFGRCRLCQTACRLWPLGRSSIRV